MTNNSHQTLPDLSELINRRRLFHALVVLPDGTTLRWRRWRRALVPVRGSTLPVQEITHLILANRPDLDADGFAHCNLFRGVQRLQNEEKGWQVFELTDLALDNPSLWMSVCWGAGQFDAVSPYRSYTAAQDKPADWYLLPERTRRSRTLVWGDADSNASRYFGSAVHVDRRTADAVRGKHFDCLLINANAWKSHDQILEMAATLKIRYDMVVSGLKRLNQPADRHMQTLRDALSDALGKNEPLVIAFSRRTCVESNYLSFFLQNHGFNLIGYIVEEEDAVPGTFWGNKLVVDQDDLATFGVDRIIRLSPGRMRICTAGVA
jgi:hypothetical protein